MRRVLESHNIAIATGMLRFECKPCNCIFESDEFMAGHGLTKYNDICPLCGGGCFEKREDEYGRQNTT
jgi:hypothetical protein